MQALRLRHAIIAALLVVGTSPAPAQQPGDSPAPTAVAAASGPTAAPAEVPALRAISDRIAAEQAGLREQRGRVQAEIDGLAERLHAATLGSAEADRLDQEVKEALTAAREQTRDALRTLREPSQVPAGEPKTGPSVSADERQQVLAAEAELRWRRVEASAEAMRRLLDLRRQSNEKISTSRRRLLLGIGREGIHQLSRELAQLRVSLEVYAAERRHSIGEIPKLTRDVFTVGSAVKHVALTVLVITAAVWARGRWREWLERVRSAAFRSVSSVRWKRRLQRLLGAVEVAAPWGLFLAALSALDWALGPATDTIEARIVLAALQVWAVYRLAVDIAAALMLSVAVHFRLAVSELRRRKLLSSTRVVLRVGAVLVIILLVSRGAGQGYLSSVVVKFAWLVIAAAIVAELFRWRREMVETFLRLQPQGQLAAAVRQSQDRWYGVFVAPGAFVWLAGRAGAAVAREFALGFGQTQKTLAYLFRRQVERQAERQGYADGDLAELPAEIVEAFREDAVERGPLVIDHFPQLAELHQILSSWRATGAAGSFLLYGERGSGKTSWLNQVQRDDLAIERIVLGERLTDFAPLAARIAESLQVEIDPGNALPSLARSLIAGQRRIVVLDMAQHLFLADVGGYDAFAGFARLVNRTCRQVFWLCSMSAYAWRHLTAVRPDAAVFRGSAQLPAWTEENIRRLIRARCSASGASFNFSDLVVDRIEGVSTEASLIESEGAYTRLLWDYADGNPRAALHFFLHSLSLDRGKEVRVRLFKPPEVGRLEAGGLEGLFVLAAVATHERISLEHLTRVTRLQPPECLIHLDRLVELGALVSDRDLYRVSTAWHRAAVRLLRRRNLLAI